MKAAVRERSVSQTLTASIAARTTEGRRVPATGARTAVETPARRETFRREAQVRHVRLPYDFTNPVVIAGPPSYNGTQPTTVRVRNVTSDSFEIRLQEYLYLDGTHILEQVAWMVVEEGTHTAPDGTQWEVGTTTAGGDPGTLSHTSFSNTYGSTPLLLVSTMTYAGIDPMVLRAQNVDATGFDLLVQEEDPNSAHSNLETVGYVAISGTPSNWDGSGYGYQMASSTSNGVDENWWTFGSIELMVQEEQSQDEETDHALEQLHVLRMEHPGAGEFSIAVAHDPAAVAVRVAGARGHVLDSAHENQPHKGLEMLSPRQFRRLRQQGGLHSFVGLKPPPVLLGVSAQHEDEDLGLGRRRQPRGDADVHRSARCSPWRRDAVV